MSAVGNSPELCESVVLAGLFYDKTKINYWDTIVKCPQNNKLNLLFGILCNGLIKKGRSQNLF